MVITGPTQNPSSPYFIHPGENTSYSMVKQLLAQWYELPFMVQCNEESVDLVRTTTVPYVGKRSTLGWPEVVVPSLKS